MVDLLTLFRWRCKDRRYLIRESGSSRTPARWASSSCLWYRNFSLLPSQLECVLTYCDSPILLPNNNGANYNFSWDGELLTELGETIFYPCRNNFRVENDTTSKEEAATGVDIVCGSDGEYVYPGTWPQCATTVTCPDPGNSQEVDRTYKSGADLEYWSMLQFVCQDPRKWIKTDETTSVLSAVLETRCHWRKTYPLDGTNLVCEIHHCRHPHDDPGKHEAPPVENKINLVERNDWDVAFGSSVIYRCASNTHIENEEVDPTQTEISVSCVDQVGEYNTPVKAGGVWPNCTETVLCGQPPPPPVNGTREWISPGQELQESYNTEVTYYCQDGSQFDTDGDGEGDEVSLTIRKNQTEYHKVERLFLCKNPL